MENVNLVPAIHQIELQILEMEHEYKIKIKPYQDSLKALRKINTACEKCEGRGRILRSRACAEDDAPDPNDPSDYIRCDVCNGTGKAKYSKGEK